MTMDDLKSVQEALNDFRAALVEINIEYCFMRETTLSESNEHKIKRASLHLSKALAKMRKV